MDGPRDPHDTLAPLGEAQREMTISRQSASGRCRIPSRVRHCDVGPSIYRACIWLPIVVPAAVIVAAKGPRKNKYSN